MSAIRTFILIKAFTPILICLVLGLTSKATAQISPGVYISENDGVRHELKIDSTYLTYSEYGKSPAKFVRTLGGFSSVEEASGKRLTVLLEFNSDYPKDSLHKLSIPMKMEGEKLVLDWFSELVFEPLPKKRQDLDGTWLFAARGPDKGQEGRGEENPRKTLKFLQDGRFQ